MGIKAEEITIAVTVFSRRKYLHDSIGGALRQTVPVRVTVVEDCGPDPGLESFVKAQFGDRVDYYRNDRRRGIFGNWNACIERCQTPWISILHDDDILEPCFIEEMLRLADREAGCGLYYGHTVVVDEDQRPIPWMTLPQIEPPSRRTQVESMLWLTPFPFPGQLFRPADAKALGGFRESSQYCGDWEMWVNLTAAFGAAQCRATVARNRQHLGYDRGTNQVIRSGKQYPLSIVQHRRVLAVLKRQGTALGFDRRAYMERYPVPTAFLARFGWEMSERLLRYHYGLLQISPSLNWRHRLVKETSRALGLRSIRLLSMVWRLLGRLSKPFASNRAC